MVCNYEKWSGLGNDFILLEALPRDTAPASWCDGSRGLSADGLLLVEPPTDGPARMTIFNRDGSRPEMCGNGLRCAVRYLVERGHDLSNGIDSDAGRHQVGALDEKAVTVTVGEPRWWTETGGELQALDSLKFFGVDVGNPHAVFFDVGPEAALLDVGHRMQSDARFPDGTNVHFVDGHDHRLQVRHFERGVGITQACGTGAAAVAWAAVETQRSQWPVDTHLPGGLLRFEAAANGQLWMTGPAHRIAQGPLGLG